jgi:hypothetical protein
VPVLQCLNTLRVHFSSNVGGENFQNHLRRRWDLSDLGSLEGIDHSQGDVSRRQHLVANGGDWQRDSVDAKFQHALRGTSGMLNAIFINREQKLCVHDTWIVVNVCVNSNRQCFEIMYAVCDVAQVTVWGK